MPARRNQPPRPRGHAPRGPSRKRAARCPRTCRIRRRGAASGRTCWPGTAATAGPAVADDRRPVPHPRVGGHAAADAGRPRAAEVPRVAGEVPVARGARRRRRGRTSRRRGGRSATTSARSACRRSRARRSRASTAGCPPTRRRCSRSRGSAATRPARSAASPSGSARPSSTPTWRACCSACSSAEGEPKSARDDAAALADLRGARAQRAHVFDFNQALMDLGAMVCTARKPAVPRLPARAIVPIRGRGVAGASRDATGEVELT